MSKEILFLVEEALEGGYNAKAIGESIYTQAESLDELKKEIKEAIAVHFEEADSPKIIRLHIVKEEVLAI